VLAPGADADVVIVDPDLEATVDDTFYRCLCEVSIYRGQKFRGLAWTTIVRGRVMMEARQTVGAPGWGRHVRRGAAGGERVSVDGIKSVDGRKALVDGTSVLGTTHPQDAAIQLRCPKGTAMLYGEVVSRGDGFDPQGHAFRAMPHIESVVAFEENAEEPRRHTFEVAGNEYRLISVDDVLVALPPRWWRGKTR
jgi:hypothetical protein